MATQGVETVPGPEDRLMSAALLDQIGEALQGAMRMSNAMDQIASIRVLAAKPEPSDLTLQLRMALQALGAMEATAAPPERVDLQLYPLSDLSPEFVQARLLERGWPQGTLVVGSAQGETLARQMLAGSDIAKAVKLAPLSGEHRVEHPEGWALIATPL